MKNPIVLSKTHRSPLTQHWAHETLHTMVPGPLFWIINLTCDISDKRLIFIPSPHSACLFPALRDISVNYLQELSKYHLPRAVRTQGRLGAQLGLCITWTHRQDGGSLFGADRPKARTQQVSALGWIIVLWGHGDAYQPCCSICCL